MAASSLAATGVAPRSRAITVETALYAGVFGLALFLRLFRLSLAPLSEHEAAQALAALRGDPVPLGGSPLLYAVNSLLMLLFSPSDDIVRLVSALVGSIVVLTPISFRDTLGRFGALSASLVLAISPVALVTSRSVDGAVLVAASTLAAIALARRYLLLGDERNLIGAAIALGIGLASGPGIYTALVALAVGALVLRFVFGGELADAWRSTWQRTPRSPQPATIALGLIGALALASTGLFTRPGGLGAAADVLSAWLGAFQADGGSSAFDIIQVLIVYEPLALTFGTIGLVYVLLQFRRAPAARPDTDLAAESAEHAERSNNSALSASSAVKLESLFGPWLGLGAMIALAIVIMQPGRHPADLVLPVMLLAVLAGYVVQPLAESVRAHASLSAEGIVLSVGGIVLAFLMLMLAGYTRGKYLVMNPTTLALPPEVPALILTVLIIGIVAGLQALMVGLRPTLRGSGVLALIALVLASFSAGWGATQVRAGDAREIIWGSSVTTPGVRLLVETANQIAIRAQGHASTLPIRVGVDDPVVGWYLRNVDVSSGTIAGFVTLGDDQPSVPDSSYIGTQIIIRKSWDTAGLTFEAWLGWALFRESASFPPQVTQTVTLWEKQGSPDSGGN